ncbi:MAG TPA: T9SS type A sorting domain-containing protein [Bacteroidales bacterium]|nr:T9SS type A sorting domain-containing protein [Bacteroidales bacterium]
MVWAYPSDYVTANFSITETSVSGNTGFTKNQINRSLIITLPANFQFNTTSTTASVTIGSTAPLIPEVVINSFVFNSTNQITVWITTAPTNVQYNTIYFNDFEIKAVSPVLNGLLRRGTTPGTFLIDNSVYTPPASRPFGTLNARTPFVYNACAVTQLVTTTINQYSVNNEILRMRIFGSGNCGSPITRFDFSTLGSNGTDSLRNIDRVEVYYSTSSTFNYATASLFGYLDTLTSTEFSINGYYEMQNSVMYFYLIYDVPGDAYTDDDGNRLDAKLKSFVIDGITRTNASTPSPSGYRRVIPSAFYYSKGNGKWTDNIWAVYDNGPLCNCQPNGAGVVILDTGHHVILNKQRKVDACDVLQGAFLEGQSAAFRFYVTQNMNVFEGAHYEFLADHIVRGNLSFFTGDTSWFHKIDSVGGNLLIAQNSALVNFASATNDLQVCGNLTVNGYLQNSNAIITLFNNTDVDGTGVIKTNNLVIRTGDKKVLPTADLLIDGGVLIKGKYMIDNFGKVNVRGNMDGDSTLSRWINEQYSVLSYGGPENMFKTEGYLESFADSNTVRYSGLTNQGIIGPMNLTYYNLVLEGAGAKSLVTDIHLHGNMDFYATLQHLQKNITVDGSLMQYFRGTVTPKAFSLTMDNNQNGLTLQIPVFYNGHLNLISGKIFTTMTDILAATDSATASTGSDISFVHGPMRKIGDDEFVYPVGKLDIWARIGISKPATTASSFTAEYFPATYLDTSVLVPLDHVSEVEYWNLFQDAKAGDSVLISLYWENPVRSGILEYSSDLVVGGYSGPWLNRDQSDILPADHGNVTSNLVHEFGAFTFGSKFNLNPLKEINDPLPISLLSFDAIEDGGHIKIMWTTATEINNDYFTVQRSANAKEFSDVAIVQGSGNSNEIIHYNTYDESPMPDISYYRLKQTDFDGKFSFSEIVAVVSGDSHLNAIYPNPFTTSLNIELNEAPLPDKNTVFIIYNLLGEQMVNIPLKNKSAAVEADDIPAGVYYYKIEVNGQPVQSGKLVSQNK